MLIGSHRLIRIMRIFFLPKADSNAVNINDDFTQVRKFYDFKVSSAVGICISFHWNFHNAVDN